MSQAAAQAILNAQQCPNPRCRCSVAARRGRGNTHCPLHQDNTPSFGIVVKDSKLLVDCYSGCDQAQVIDALRSRGLWPESAHYGKDILAEYDYKDASGKLLYQAVRYFPKEFKQRRPGSAKNTWVWNLDGVSRVLYRLPELLSAEPQRLRFIVEGEKDVERLMAMGCVATCNVGGAGKWRTEYAEFFRDRTVVIVVDNDEPGRRHGLDVAFSLRNVAHDIRWLEVPEVEEHGDISDWLDDGADLSRLHALVNAAPRPPTQEDRREVGEDGEVVLLASDKVQITLPTAQGPIEFTFAEMEKTSARELEAEMSVQMLQPGTAGDVYTTRLNILSSSTRDQVKREVQDVLELDKTISAKLLNRAYSQARSMFLEQDRTQRIRDIHAPTGLNYMVEQLLLEERPTILFGPGGSLKTYVLMSLMLAMARGVTWLGRETQQRNVLLIDYETGPRTTALRLRRLATALGLDDIPENLFLWNAAGIPLQDLVHPIKRSIEANQIGFLGIDHCAAAAGTEPEKSEAALDFYRAVGRLETPTCAIAHVTGDVATNPELAKRPFGSIFWDNGAGLTWFLQKEEQDEGSPLATIGLFQKKFNDTGRLRDFSVRVTFDGDSGPITLARADLRESATLLATKGQKDVIYEALTRPLTIEQLHQTTGIGVATIRAQLNKHTRLFEKLPDTAGRRGQWQRSERNTVTPQNAVTDVQGLPPLRGGRESPQFEVETVTQPVMQMHSADWLEPSVTVTQSSVTALRTEDVRNGHVTDDDLPW